MRCDEFTLLASDLVEGTLAPDRRQAAEAHLATCAACRSLLADLTRITGLAASLERRPVPPAAFATLAARLASEPGWPKPVPQAASHAAPSWTWLAVAAALVAVIGSSLWLVARSFSTPETAVVTGNGQPPDLVQSVEAELALAAEHYEKAISGLEQIANASDSPLDPAVMATLRENLRVIDDAIEESRVALKSQPDSRLAQESLFEAFRRKIGLLQDTIALMNEMRKGDEAGAARIVEGLTKS